MNDDGLPTVYSDYLLKKLTFQMTHPAPLLQRDYYTDPPEYYELAMLTVGGYDEIYGTQLVKSLPQKFSSEMLGNKDSVRQKAMLVTAMVNMTKLGRQMDEMEKIDFAADYYFATGTLCAFVQHLQDGVKPANNDQLLLLHPVQHDQPDINVMDTDEKVAAKFFAYLLNKKFITTEQVENSELRLGTLYPHILAEQKRMLDAEKKEPKSGRTRVLAVPSTAA